MPPWTDGWTDALPPCRYHTGSLAFGALILAIVQLIRVILEYLDHRLKGAAGRTEGWGADRGTGMGAVGVDRGTGGWTEGREGGQRDRGVDRGVDRGTGSAGMGRGTGMGAVGVDRGTGRG